VLKRYPSVKRKLHLLGVLADGDDAVIRDPYGKDVDRYNETYRIIARALDSAAARL